MHEINLSEMGSALGRIMDLFLAGTESIPLDLSLAINFGGSWDELGASSRWFVE